MFAAFHFSALLLKDCISLANKAAHKMLVVKWTLGH
jgi:hypothetical protein